MADTQNPTDTSFNDPSNNPEGVIPKLYSLDKDLYTSKGVSLDDFTLAMSNPAVQNKVFNKHIDKFAAKKVTFRDFQSSLNIEPSREKGSLKDYIYQLEHDPKKGYYSFNPDSKSGAVGGYQIIYDNNVEEKNKQKYGVNRDQFLSNPFVQEEYMSDRINDEYIPNLDALKEINKAKGNKYNDYELAYLIHHEGLAGAKHFLKNGKSLHGSEKALESQFAKGRTYLEQVQALSENKIDSNPNQDEDSKLAEYYKANPNTGSKSWFSNAILSTDLFLGDVKKTKTLEDGTEVYLRDGGEKVYKLPDGRVVRSLTDKNNAALKAGKNIVTDTMIGGVIGTAGMLFGAARDIGEKLAYHTTDGKAGDNNWDSVYNNDLSAFAKDMKQSLKINKPDFTPERLQKIDIKEGDDAITKLSKYVSYIAEESGNPDFWYNEGAQGISSMLEMRLPSMFVGKLGGKAVKAIMKNANNVEDLTKLQKIAIKGTEYVTYSAFNGALESAIEAESIYKTVKSDLYAKNSFLPDDKQLSDDEINRKASKRASSGFVDNFALISGSNLLEADNLMGNLGGRSFMGKAAKLLLKAGLQAGVEAFQEVGQFGIEKYETSKLDKKDTKHEGNLFQRLYSGAAETISGVAGTIKDEYDKGSPELAKSAFLGGLLGGGMTSVTQLTKEVINYPISKTINETAPESILDFYQKDENGNIKYNDKNEPVIDKSALSTYLSKVDNDYQNIAAKNLANEIDDKLAADVITAGSFASFIQKHKAKDRSSDRLREVFDSYALTDEQYNLLGISKRKDKKEYVDERNSMFEIGLRAYDEISSIKQKLTPDSFNKAFEHFYKQKFVFSKIQSNQAKIDNYDAQTQLTDVESANRDNLVKEQERLNGLFTFYGSLVNSSIGKQTKTKDNKDNIGEDTSIPKDKEDFVEDSPKDTSKDTKKTEDLPSTQQEKEDQKDDLSKVEIPVQDPIVDSSKVDFKTEPKPLVTDEEGNFLSPDELDSSSDIDENNGNDNADIKESVVFDDEIKDNNQNDNIPVPTNTTTNPVSSTEVDQQSETQPVNESDVSSEEIPIEPTDDDVSKAIALESSDRKEVLASIPRIKINNSVQPGDVITNKEGVEFVIKSVKGNKVTYTTKTIDDVFNKVNKPHQFVRTTTIPVNAKVSDTVDNTGSVSPISESIETDETLQHSKVYVLNNKESKDSVGSTLAISQLDNSSVIVKRTESINGVVAYIDYISRAVVDRFKKLWNPYFLKHENGDFKGFSIQKSDFPYVAIPNFDISYITDPNGKPINFSRVEDGQYKGLVLLSEVKKYFDNNKFLRVGYGKDETAFDIKYELVDFLPFTTVFSGVDSEIFIRQSSSLTTANTDSSSLREEILQLQQLRRYIQNKIDKGGFVSARITKKDAGIMRLIVPKNTSVASKSSLNKVSPISIYRSSVNNEFDLPILIPNIKNPNRAFIDGTLREVTLIERLGKEVEYYKPSMLYPVDINSDGEVVYNTIYLKNRKLGESNIMGTYGSVPIVNEHSIKNTNNLIYTAELLLSRLYGIDLTIEEKDLLDKLKVKNTIKEVKDYIDSFVRSDLKLISDGVLGSKDSAIHISTMFQLALYNPETKTHQLYTNRPQNQAKGISREAIKATLRDMWFTMNYNYVIGNNTIDVIDEVTKEVLSLNYRELAFDNIYPDYEIFKGDEDSKIGHTIYSPSVNSRIHFEVNGFEYKPETIATTTIPIQVQYPVKIESTVVENDFSNIPDEKIDTQTINPSSVDIKDVEAQKVDIQTQSELPTDSEFVTERTLDDAENEFPGENPNITSQDITKPTEIQELDLPDNIDDDILAFETEDDYFLNNLTIENSNSIPGVPQVHLNNIVNILLGRVSRLIENGKLDKEKAKVLEINTMKQLYVNAKASLELTLTKAIPGTKKYEQLKSYLDIVEKVVDNYHIVDSLFNKSFLAITGKDFENNSADNQYNEDRIITLNPKDKTRATIKLFLLKIKEMDDKNNTKKFFLNSLGIKGAEDLYQHIDVDKALNILFNILTVKTGFYYEPNLENVIKILDDNSKSYPFLTDIAFYLKHTPEIGPEFVRSFYSIDSRYSKLIYTDDIQNGVTYTTLIDNQTNFKSGATKLRNSWKNNLTSLIGFNNVNRLVLDPNSQLGAKLLFIKELFGDSKSRILDYNTGEINLSNTRLSVNQIATIQPWIDSINKTLVNLNNPNVDPRDVLSNKFIYTKKLLINELLKNLGINLDNDVLSKLDNPDYKLLLSNGKSVVFNSNKIFDSRKKLLQNIDQLLIGTSDVNSLLKQDIIREIASFVAQHSKNNNFHSDRMFQDGNKSVSVFQIPRYFYLRVAKLTDLSTGFLETLISLRNNKKHYSSNSYWKHLIKTNNLNYSTAALQATEEIRRNNSEKDIHEFPEKKLLEAMIANFLSGVNNTTSNVKMKLFGKTISDSKMMTYFEVPKLDLFLGYDAETTYILSDENNGEVIGKTKISEFLIDQILMPDVNRILNDDTVQLKSYNKDVFYSVPSLNDFTKYGLNSIKEVASVISNPDINPTAYNLIENAFKEYLNNEISATKELFQKYRIGYSSDTKSWSMVSKDAVDYYTERSVAGSDTKIAPETIHNQIVKDFVLNYLVGYSNSSMLIYGDPAIYTKGNINTTMNNVIKRLKTFASPREVLDTNIYKKLSGKDSISYLVVKDDVSPVNSIKYITNLLDGLEITDEEVKILRDKNSSVDDKNIIYNKYPNSSGYFKNNHADAQEFVHWKHHLDTLVALGELKIHDYNNIVDIIENHPEKIKNSDILKVFAPFKPLYSGTVIKGPIEQQFYIKSSHIPLLPGFSGGLEPLILFMEKNTIDRLAFESSVKLGIENTIELFENTKLKNLSDLKKLDIDNATLNLPIENYGKQLHNPIKDKNEITVSTQAQKGIFGNIKNEFVEFKGKQVKVADLEKLRDKLHGEAQEFLKQELIKALDPNDTGEMDIESLLGLMNSELESGRYDDNIKQSISFDKERNVLRVPLWLSSNPGALEAIITNIINSGGVSGIKRPGIGLVQASSIGQTVVSDQLKDFDNNIIFTEKYNPKKGLQHGVKNKKGQYVSQIIVPWYFKEKMDYFVNGKNQIDLSKLPEDLLTIFGFRIPNQFHASMIGLEIVGFLPPSFGNTVLVPTEITSQMGSDFDVDKLYSYIKALDFKVDQEALDLSKKVKKEISNYWKAVSNDFRNQYPDLIARKKEIEESYVDVAKKLDWEQKDIDLHSEIVDALSTAREYDTKRKELEKELSLLNQKIKESARYELTNDYLNNLWNQILDIELSVITSNNEVIQRSVRQALDTPTEQLSDVADHLQKLQNSTQKQQSHISPIYNIQKYFAGSQAKSLVGNTSLALVFNFIIQNKSFSISNKSYIPVSFDGDFVHKNLSNPFTVKTDNELKQAYEKFKNGVFVEDLINGTQQLYDITEIPSDVLDDYRREKVKQDLAKELSDRTGISVRWVDSIDSLSNNQLGSIKDEVYRELDNYFFDYISGRKMYQRHENLPNYIKINNDAFINNTQKNRIATRLADSIKKNTNGKFVGSLEGTEDSYVIKINTSTSYRRDLNNRYNKDNSKLQSKSLSDIDIFEILNSNNLSIEESPELQKQQYQKPNNIGNRNNLEYQFKVIDKIAANLGKVNQWYKQLGNSDKFWSKVQQDLQIPKEQIALLKESEGDTASKIEGHSTLEEFKKQKENRIKELEEKLKNLENDNIQGAYDFSATSNSGKWNSANNELLSLVQNNRKAFAIYKFLIGDAQSFKEIINFLNEKGIEIEYTERMKRADETMSAEEIQSAIDSYNNSVNEKAEDKNQIEKDILSENNLQDETEYTPQELIEKYPLSGVQKVIWNLIKDIVAKLGIKVKFSSSRITEGFDGSNNPQNGEILIRPSTLKNGRFTEVLVHEVVHALTTKIISRVNSGVTTGLTQKQINAVKGLMKLYEAIKANNNLQNKYPVKDVFEFIAHLTNEEFVKELETKDKNFLQKVVDFILDILGITNANELSKKYLVDIISDGTFLEENGITILPSDYGNNLQGSKSEEIKKIKDEINQLKQELEKVEKEGFGALKPIYKFYEETVGNILKKQYKDDLQKITDEYENSWYEITLDNNRDTKSLLLNKDENSKIYGYYDKLLNEIVLSKDADQEVIFHEFIHPFMESYKIMNPKQHGELLDEAYTILGQELSDQIVLNYPENQVENEIITRAISRVANNNVDSNSGKTFFKKMLEFINYIKTQLHRAVFAKMALGKSLDMKDISELQTIQELADMFTLYKGKINPNISNITTTIDIVNTKDINKDIYRDIPVINTKDITTQEGTKGAASYSKDENLIRVDRELLEQKFKEKAWTNPRKLIEILHEENIESYAQSLSEDQFKTYQEWENFVMEHEYQYSLYSREDYNKDFPENNSKGGYETEINNRALNQLDREKDQTEVNNVDLPDYKSIPNTTNSIKQEDVVMLKDRNPNIKIIPINSYNDFIYNLSESMIKEKRLAENIEYKSSSIIGIQSAAVDDANKNLLDKINFTRDTSLAAIILLQQGLNYNQVFTLLSQPVIKEYVNNLTKKGKGFDYNANLEQISYESAYNQYASNLSEEELDGIKSFDFKLSGLEESLKNPDSTSKAHSIRQIKALNVFRHYSTKYSPYIGIMNAANINTTGGGKNLSTMSSVLTSVDDIMGNNTFRNANKVLQEGVHTHSIKNLAELFNFVMKKDNGLSILNHKSNIYDTLYFEISSYLNNRNVPITPWIKNKIFEGIRNVVKAYMFSSLTSSISDKQAEDIRQELLKGNDRKPPLGIILLNLKAKNYKSIANSTFNSKRISDNSFLNIIDIKKEKDSNNTFITADVNDNKLDINEIHKDLEDLFNTPIELENGYNTKHLILDLIKYDFVMGRKQSAKSFTKYLPETLIQKIILNNDLLNNTLDELSLFDSEKINSLTKNVLFYTPELITQIPNITSDSEPTFIHDVDEDQVSLGQMRINYKAVNNDTIISNALFTKLEGSDDVIVNPIIKVYDVIYEYDSTLMKYIKVTGLTNSSYGIGINNDLSSPRRLNIPVTNLSIINATTYSDKEVSTPTGILSSIKRELDRVTHSNEKATTKNNSNILTQVLDYMGALNDYSIEFVDTLENISVGGKERKNLYGYTDVANKRIVIARDLKDRGNLTYSRVLLHEIGHIVTNTYISEYLNQLATGKSDTLTKEQITTLNRVYKVYQRLESDKEFTSQLERPINNFHEFVTEVISSHDFRTKVDKNYKASIFEKINEFIKSILKQVFGETNNYVGYSDTLLGDILSIPTNNSFNTQIYSSKDDSKIYIVKKLGDDVLSVSTFNDAGNPASYVDAQSIYDKIKDYDKRDVKIYEDAYNIKKVSDNVLGEFTITTVNGIVSIKDSNNNTISETDLRHGLILGFETQEESQEESQGVDPKTDTLKFVSSISDNKIRSLDIKYKKLFSIINNRLTNVSKKIKIQEDVIKNIKAKKSISALENNTLLNNNIKKLDALESEFNTLIVSLNKIAELKGVSDLYKFFAQSEGDFVNILSKEEISFAEANYLSSLFNEILYKFNPNSPNYYLDKNEFINLGSSEKKDIIEKLSGFEARLKTTYLEQLLNHKRKMVKDSLNVYSQNRLSDEKFKEIIDSELKDISELQRWFLGADRVDDEFTNMVVNRMQQVAQQGVSQSAEYSNKLKELYQRIIPSLKKYSSPNDKFGIISVLLDNFGNFISDYTEDFFDSQNKMLSDFKQQLTAANGDKFKIRNAFLKRNRWNIQNKVALNPKYLLEEDELKDLGLKFVKSANFEQDKQKYLDYIRSTVGMYKFDRMVESVRRSARDYNEEYNTLKTTLNDQITSGVIDAAQKKEALRTFQAKYSPIIAADYNFNPKLINSVARELGKKDSSELYISDKYVKLVPKKFEGVKSLYETNQGYTKFYDKNIQKFYDNSEYDILDFIDHVNDLLHMGVHLIPEEKRFGISTRSLPFIEKDLLENLISEPISLLGLKNRVKDISASIRSLGAYKTTDQYKELPVDFVSSAAVNDKNQEIKDKINLKIKEYYLSKDILPDEIAKTTDPKLKDSDLYYPTVYKRIKQEVYDEVNKLRSFDIVKGLSMYAQQVYNYKTKAENSDEVGLLIDMVEQRLKNKGVDSINGSIVKDIEHSKHSSAQERIKMFTNFLNNYRELSTNKPTAKFKNVRGKHYSNFEKQQLEELKQYLSKLESINKDKLSDEQKIVIETEIDKIKSNIDELGKDVYLVDSIIAPLIIFTQLKGLGWNFVSYMYNLSIGQLNNYYESKDGRIFTADSYKDSIKDVLKHSSGAKFGFGILGMLAGGITSPFMLPGLMLGFTSGIAIGKLAQKYYETFDKEGKTDVDKIFNFYAKHDVLNKVQNENYRTFTDSSPVVSQKLQKLKDTSLGKFISNYLSIYKSTEAAEDINQGVIGLSYIRSVAIDDINGVNRPLIDFINQDGSINEELLPQRVQLNDVNLSKTEFVNRMVTEIKNTIRRTQGDYESLFKSDIKSKILGKAGMQFKTWMPETIMKDFEVAKKDQGITDILTGEKYTRKGVYVSLLEKAGLFNTSIVFTSNILTPLMLTSLLTGAFIPALALGSGGAAALFYANKKADKSKVDPLVTKALVKSVFNELPFIKRFIGSKEPNKYFSDLLNNEDAGNFRALAAKLKVNIGLLSVYMIFSILKEVVKGDDDDDDKNKMLSKLSYTLLNLAGKTYSDNSLTLDPTSSFDRFSEVKNIIPAITTAGEIGEIVLKPGIWGEQYERDQYKGSPTGYKKGDFKQLVKLEKIIPGPNRVSQLEYMMTNKYRMFDLGN
ncbi:MAG TPA: hypothetical protein PKD16_01405 [Saprospiraceae bacterium]|jgi:hypothetical protein|nr:hypothetical protein [Saprospiraceae bacterium]